MDTRTDCRLLPLRIAVGAFFLDSGLAKRTADDQAAERLHGFARGTYPFLGRVPPHRFVRLLSAAEIALATALLVPAVPAAAAGAGLTAFALGTVGLYLRTPGMRQPGSLRPTEDGMALAKDVWLVGAGLSLLADGAARCPRRTRRGRRGGFAGRRLGHR